jgi:hypothetical protein
LGFGKKRYAVLVCHQSQDELLQIHPAVFGMAKGYLDSVSTAWTLIISLDAEARSIGMKPLNSEIQLAHNLQSYIVEEFCRTVGINRIKGPAEGIIVQVCGGDTFTEQPLDGKLLVKLREQIQSLANVAQSVQDHGLYEP